LNSLDRLADKPDNELSTQKEYAMKHTNAQYLMIDALDGPAIAYWAEVKNVKHDEQGKCLSFQVRDGGYEDERVSKEWVTITELKIEHAAMCLLSGTIEVRRDIAAQFIGKEWKYDSEGVDCIIQAICFDKLIFR
jgi:hypothetical protein